MTDTSDITITNQDATEPPNDTLYTLSYYLHIYSLIPQQLGEESSDGVIIPVHRGGTQAPERMGACLGSHSTSLTESGPGSGLLTLSLGLSVTALSSGRISWKYYQRKAVLWVGRLKRGRNAVTFDLNPTERGLDEEKVHMKNKPSGTGDSVLGHLIDYFKKDWFSNE